MPYVILCYRDERVIDVANRTSEAHVANELRRVIETQLAAGVLKFSVKLLATTTSTTLRLLRGSPLVIDGPAFEAGGQVQGLYLVDCPTLDDALAVARAFADIEPGGIYEVRPVADLFVSNQCGSSHGRT